MDIEKDTKEDVQTITVEDIKGYSLTPSTKQRKKIGFGA